MGRPFVIEGDAVPAADDPIEPKPATKPVSEPTSNSTDDTVPGADKPDVSKGE